MNFYQIFSDLVDRICMKISDSILVDGIWVGNMSDLDGSKLLGDTAKALRLLQTYDPVRYARICEDIRSIWLVSSIVSTGMYKHRLRLIELDAVYFIEAAPEVIASVIVHEATHARLMKFGYEEEKRARIERICIKQEINFASRLPNGGPIVQWAKDRLNMATNEFHSNAAMRKRERKREVEVGRRHGLPMWLIRILQSRADKQQMRIKLRDQQRS